MPPMSNESSIDDDIGATSTIVDVVDFDVENDDEIVDETVVSGPVVFCDICIELSDDEDKLAIADVDGGADVDCRVD